MLLRFHSASASSPGQSKLWVQTYESMMVHDGYLDIQESKTVLSKTCRVLSKTVQRLADSVRCFQLLSGFSVWIEPLNSFGSSFSFNLSVHSSLNTLQVYRLGSFRFSCRVWPSFAWIVANRQWRRTPGKPSSGFKVFVHSAFCQKVFGQDFCLRVRTTFKWRKAPKAARSSWILLACLVELACWTGRLLYRTGLLDWAGLLSLLDCVLTEDSSVVMLSTLSMLSILRQLAYCLLFFRWRKVFNENVLRKRSTGLVRPGVQTVASPLNGQMDLPCNAAFW